MTTAAAEQRYLAQHLVEWAGKGYAVHNPQGLPLGDLPVIYGFNNGGADQCYEGVLLAEDGTYLGKHICSHECYMLGDLGVLDGSRSDRHKTFMEHYPDGYRMDFVPMRDSGSHAGLESAYANNQLQRIADQAIAARNGTDPLSEPIDETND